MEDVILSPPTRNAKIASYGDWVAVSTDGVTLHLKNKSEFSHIFRFDQLIFHLVFSPTSNSIFVILKDSRILKKSLTRRSLQVDSEHFPFVDVITLPFMLDPKSFVSVIPFEKATYIIVDQKIYMVLNQTISNEFALEHKITAVCAIPTGLARSFSLIEDGVIAPFIIVVGTSDGSVSTLSFPNHLSRHDAISNYFTSKSERITSITFSDSYSVCVGRHGTIVATDLSNNTATGQVVFPVSSVSINKPNILFVSQGRLYSAPILSPGSFKLASFFPARIACAAGGIALTTSGALCSLGESSTFGLSPRPELIEFALERLREIGEAEERISERIGEAEARLVDLQLIRALQSGRRMFDGSVNLIPRVAPHGRCTVDALVKLKPLGEISCRGLSVTLCLTDALGRTDVYSIPAVRTANVVWQQHVAITRPTFLRADVIVSQAMRGEGDAAVALSADFDIFDFSAQIDPAAVSLALGGGPKVLGVKNSVPTQFPLLGKIPDVLRQPLAFLAPTNEQWTIRVDGEICTVTASSKGLTAAVQAAVERRTQVEGNVAIDESGPAIKKISDAVEALSDAGPLLMHGNGRGTIEYTTSEASKGLETLIKSE